MVTVSRVRVRVKICHPTGLLMAGDQCRVVRAAKQQNNNPLNSPLSRTTWVSRHQKNIIIIIQTSG